MKEREAIGYFFLLLVLILAFFAAIVWGARDGARVQEIAPRPYCLLYRAHIKGAKNTRVYCIEGSQWMFSYGGSSPVQMFRNNRVGRIEPMPCNCGGDQ